MVLGEPDPLPEWSAIERMVTSSLTEVESARTLDRMRLLGDLTDDELATFRETVARILGATDVINLDRQVLGRAAQPFPTPLGTLDAIHLASALLYRDDEPDLVLATHDTQLATAARASGVTVIGWKRVVKKTRR